jgi:hypothetical protein
VYHCAATAIPAAEVTKTSAGQRREDVEDVPGAQPLVGLGFSAVQEEDAVEARGDAEPACDLGDRDAIGDVEDG